MAGRGCLGNTLLAYCAINIGIGLGLVACGIWMHAAPDVYAYITVFVRSTNDKSLVAAAALILTAGIILSLLSLLGVFGVLKRNVLMMSAYMWLLPLVIIMGVVAGFMTVALYYDSHLDVKQAMLGQLSTYYDWESRIGKAWNRVQVKKRCCGVDGSWDYEKTDWYKNQNPIDAPVTTYVPDSCCVLNFNQDRDLYRVDPQNPQLKDPKRCQEDAAGRILNGANLNQRGCFASLYQINKDLWHDVTIVSIMYVIEGLGLGAGFLQVFGMGLAFFYIASFRRPPEKSRAGK